MDPRGAAGGNHVLTCRIIHDHVASYPDAPVFSAGEELTVESRETVWEGWVWCVNREGRGAWVPEGFVTRRGGVCTALRDYDSSELNVRAGDVVEVHEEAAGWLWCRDREGRWGWIPAFCTERREA
ncbi:MAG: hypothetical protein HPY75_06515 [Actinobacteria bacterium]|nr:hypothetical protein [Actinomycetota bacterium]